MKGALALVALVPLLAGSTGDGPHDGTCPATNAWARVAAINGTRVDVVLMDFSAAVLDTDGTEFYYYAGSADECFESKRSLLTQGQEIEVFVDAWQASDPPRAKVPAIVILG